MTPIGLSVKKYVDARIEQLERDNITHWLMHFRRENGVNIDAGRGRKIHIGGVQFEGQVRDIYWSSLDALFEDLISDSFRLAHAEGKLFDGATARAGLEEAATILKAALSQALNKMADVDRKLIGRGFPENVPLKDVSGLVIIWSDKIDEWNRSYEAARQSGAPKGIGRLGHWVDSNKITFIFTAILGLAGGIVGGVVVNWLTK